jgi:hypothetical protein
VSTVEILNYLKKNLGIIIKRLEESGVLTLPAANDHEFIPEVEVTDAGVEVPVEGFLYSVRADPSYAPVKLNLDRPVTDTEYTVVFPGVIKVISRIAHRVYLKAPEGQVARARIEALRAA